ncbi:MAG: BTAD domain-containing putative transcriptional regulator [Sphingomonas sp.]
MASRIAPGHVLEGSRWRLATAGRFSLIHGGNGRDASPATRKARAILALLCSHPGQRFTRERVATLLWGDRGEAQAKASLRQALLQIRQSTAHGPVLLGSDRENIWVEAAAVETRASSETALGQNDEPLFDGLDHVTPEFDDWLALARGEHNRKLADVLRQEIDLALNRNRGVDALPLVDRLQRLDPFDEQTLRLALRAEYQVGSVAGIERRIREMDKRLQQELGVSVSSESKAVRQELVKALSAPVEPCINRPETRIEVARVRPLAQARRNGWGQALAAGMLALIALAIAVSYLSGTKHAPKIVAVLPFDGLSREDGDLAGGLSDDLISLLAQNRALRVVGRTSAWQFRGKVGDLRSIGRQLGVDYLVEGEVFHSGDMMRVNVSLIRAADGTATWSRIYRSSAQDLPDVRAAIGIAVSAALGSPQRAFAAAYKPDGEAYALYLEAKSLFRQRDRSSMEKAQGLLLHAARIDPKFAPAWAYAGGIANLLGEDRFSVDPSRRDAPTVTPLQALDRALALDPDLPDAHGFMGWISGPYSAQGFAHLQRAIQLDPDNSQLLFWYSMALYRYGDFARYSIVARKAARLDPLWQRSVEAAASDSQWAGDQVAVGRYLRVIRQGNPGGADEVESSLAAQRGDLARSIEIALKDERRPYQISTEQAAINLSELGFEHEGQLLSQSREKKLWSREIAPSLRSILEQAQKDPDFDYAPALWQLRTRGRYKEIVELYDAGYGQLGNIRHPTYFNRRLRSELGGPVAQALWNVGRRNEAEQVLRVAETADREILATGTVPPCFTVAPAANQAVAGHQAQAVALLERALASADCMGITYNGQIDPLFSNLRHDPRFKVLIKRHLEHLLGERNKVIAMHLF